MSNLPKNLYQPVDFENLETFKLAFNRAIAHQGFPKNFTKQTEPEEIHYIYILELEDNCYYVGKTINISKRLIKHFSGDGAVWVREHPAQKVLSIMRTTKEKSRDMENKFTFVMMKYYGVKQVRGGDYTQKSINSDYIQSILDKIDNLNVQEVADGEKK